MYINPTFLEVTDLFVCVFVCILLSALPLDCFLIVFLFMLLYLRSVLHCKLPRVILESSSAKIELKHFSSFSPPTPFFFAIVVLIYQPQLGQAQCDCECDCAYDLTFAVQLPKTMTPKSQVSPLAGKLLRTQVMRKPDKRAILIALFLHSLPFGMLILALR